LTGKKWLENRKPPKPPITENFPELPKNSEPIFTANKPKLTESLIIKQTSPQLIKQKLIIEPKPHERKILAKITGQQSINPLREQPIEKQNLVGDQKELILLAKIRNLEEQLRKTQALVDQEKKRADKAEQLLQKIGYYQQLEKEQNPVQRAQIIQPPPLKVK
jgi:hypothetical protein